MPRTSTQKAFRTSALWNCWTSGKCWFCLSKATPLIWGFRKKCYSDLEISFYNQKGKEGHMNMVTWAAPRVPSISRCVLQGLWPTGFTLPELSPKAGRRRTVLTLPSCDIVLAQTPRAAAWGYFLPLAELESQMSSGMGGFPGGPCNRCREKKPRLTRQPWKQPERCQPWQVQERSTRTEARHTKVRHETIFHEAQSCEAIKSFWRACQQKGNAQNCLSRGS